MKNSKENLEKAKRIKCLITDVDGVLTDGGIIYNDEGVEWKRFQVKDGIMVGWLKQSGILVGAITGRNSKVVQHRLKELKFDWHYHGKVQKIETLQKVAKEHNLLAEEIAYIGDDFPDIPCLQWVGLSACPGDAAAEVKSMVDIELTERGGEGAFRAFGKIILEAQQKWDEIVNAYKIR